MLSSVVLILFCVSTIRDVQGEERATTKQTPAGVLQRHPYYVSIEHGGKHECGGAIVSRRSVITAARCIPDDIDSLTIHAGTHSRSNGVVYEVERYVKHPGFSSSDAEIPSPNDIAVLSIDRPFESDCRPVELSKKFHPDWQLSVAGYGLTGYGFKAELKEVQVQTVGERVCAAFFKRADRLRESQFCAAFINSPGKLASQEDRGDPAIGPDGTLVGVLSFLKSYRIPIKPEVYTKVSHYHDWLTKVIID